MAAAAHGVRGAEDDEIPGLARGDEHAVMHGEFGHPRAEGAVVGTGFGLAVIVAEHRCAMGAGEGGDAGDAAGHFRAALPDGSDEGGIGLGGDLRAAGLIGHLLTKRGASKGVTG